MSKATAAAKTIVRAIRRVRRAVRETPRVVRMVMDPERSEIHPQREERKSTLRIVAENLGYLFRYGEVDAHYFQYGLDRKGVRLDAVLAYPEFRRMRDSRNTAPTWEGYNYVCLLRDKFVFGQLAASLGYRTPRNLAFLAEHSVEWLETRKSAPLSSLLASDVDGFCKPFAGILGRGAFALRVEGGCLFVDDRPATIEDVRSRLHRERFLLQERLAQHPAAARLHPSSLNTARLITVLENGTARLFHAHLRIGTGGHTADTPERGGIALSLDAEGRGAEAGVSRMGGVTWLTHHPDTGVPFADFVFPHFAESIGLACRFHEDLRHFHTIGWDVAATPDGPAFIEGNDNWGGTTTTLLTPGFKEQFLALFE